jgi:hypothetical protein
MAIFEVKSGPINYNYLMNKTKSDLACLILDYCQLLGLKDNIKWQPTAANINALPKAIKQYIHDLETLSDPAGIIAENILIRDELEMIKEKIDGNQRL